MTDAATVMLVYIWTSHDDVMEVKLQYCNSASSRSGPTVFQSIQLTIGYHYREHSVNGKKVTSRSWSSKSESIARWRWASRPYRTKITR